MAATVFISSCVIAVNESGAEWRGFGSHFSSENTIEGSGKLAEEKRHMDSFNSVTLRGALDVRIEVGPENRVLVSGDSNLLAHVLTEVSQGNLAIGMKSGSYSFRKPLVVTIQTPNLNHVALEGSGDIHIVGIADASFGVSLSGSGDIAATGNTQSLSVTLSGSGDIELVNLHADVVRVVLAGSGDVRVHAKETISATLSGSGEIGYTGSPRVTKSTSGSGDIYKIN